jgi:hypothetical protein
MRTPAFAFVAALACTWASVCQAYDAGWYKWDDWSGEYPPGFSVTGKSTTLMGRADMDKDLPRNVACELPYRAVIHPWNKARIKKSNVKFQSATKILKLVVKEDFALQTSVDGKETTIPIRKDDVLEYLHGISEGAFEVRLNGKLYTAEQDLFEHVEDVGQEHFPEDDWAVLTCQNATRAFIFLDDLHGEKNSDEFVPGISETGPGVVRYGTARDLTDAEAVKLERQRGK